MEIIIADDPNNEELQAFKKGLAELAAMPEEERRKDARWVLLNSQLNIDIRFYGVIKERLDGDKRD